MDLLQAVQVGDKGGFDNKINPRQKTKLRGKPDKGETLIGAAASTASARLVT